MTTLNNIQLIDRPNRPGVLQRVGLRAIFLNNGALTDPYEISSVTIFAKEHNRSPSSVLNDEQVIDASAVSSVAKMCFSNYPNTLTNHAAFDPTGYTGARTDQRIGDGASGIYKLRTGDYICVLDGTTDLSGNLSSLVGYNDDGAGKTAQIGNTASAVQDYIDVWTVRHVAGSKATTVVNNFRLFNDSFVVVTEPILLDPKHRLINKHVRLGEVVDLKVESENSVGNRNIDESIRNIFDQSVIASGKFLIQKINEEDGLPAHVTVSGYADTSSAVEVTSDDTLIFNWDTNILKNWSGDATEQGKREDVGSPRGTYSVQVKYTIIGETRISPRLYFQIN